jgi:hypothetical protein
MVTMETGIEEDGEGVEGEVAGVVTPPDCLVHRLGCGIRIEGGVAGVVTPLD